MNFKVQMRFLYSSFKLFILHMEKTHYHDKTLIPTLF